MENLQYTHEAKDNSQQRNNYDKSIIETVDFLLDVFEAQNKGYITESESASLVNDLEKWHDNIYNWWSYIESLEFLKLSDINKIISGLKTNKQFHIEAGQLDTDVQIKIRGKYNLIPVDWMCFPEDDVSISQLTTLANFVSRTCDTIMKKKSEIIDKLNKSRSYKISKSDDIWEKINIDMIQLPYGRSYDLCLVCSNSFDPYHEILIYCKNDRILYID